MLGMKIDERYAIRTWLRSLPELCSNSRPPQWKEMDTRLKSMRCFTVRFKKKILSGLS